MIDPFSSSPRSFPSPFHSQTPSSNNQSHPATCTPLMLELSTCTATVRAWRTVRGFLAFLFQILVQILRESPSLVRVSFLSSSSSSSSDSPAAFKPLPTDDPPPAAAVQVNEAFDKLTVVLDLDETLVCAYETSSLPVVVRNQAIEAGLNCFELECLSMDKDADGKPKVNYVTVFERPGLHEFLNQTSEFAELVLFTAGLEGYARPLVDRIDVENRFSLRLYRPSTVSTEFRDHVKDLSCISNNQCRIVIVDNNPFSFLLQPSNGIPCVPFSVGQPYDNQLLSAILPLLQHLSVQKDVRPVLYERFHMPEWFQKHGIPRSDTIL